VGLGELVDGALSTDSYQKIVKALRMLAPLHAEFIRHAAHTPTGKIRTKSNFSRTHSPGLYLYAKSFVLEGWSAPSKQHSDTHGVHDFYNDVSQSLQDSRSSRQARLASAPKIPVRILTTSTSFRRNPDVVAEVLLRAEGKCEGCFQPAPFVRASDGTPYLEVHHRVMLAADGEDTVVNAIALCPNCHRAAHYA
jgi:5-methylcytosine-specific restriction protein A